MTMMREATYRFQTKLRERASGNLWQEEHKALARESLGQIEHQRALLLGARARRPAARAEQVADRERLAQERCNRVGRAGLDALRAAVRAAA